MLVGLLLFKNGCCQLQAKVCARIRLLVSWLVKLAQEKSVVT